MKKIMFGAAVLAAFSLASCKKANRVCECTYSDGTTDTYTLEDKTTKKNAKFYCESDEGSNINGVYTNSNGDTETETKDPGTSCKLK